MFLRNTAFGGGWRLFVRVINKIANRVILPYSLLFRKEHLELPLNEGEKRESLIILEKIDLMEGLLKKLGTEAMVRSILSLVYEF